MLTLRKRLESVGLSEPTRTHAVALARRLAASLTGGVADDRSDIWAAALEYLAARVVDPELDPGPIAERYAIPVWDMLGVLPALRAETDYRGYIGEWIRDGRPTFEEELVEEEAEPWKEELGDFPVAAPEWVPEDDVGEEPDQPAGGPLPVPRGPTPLTPPGEAAALPSRWRADFSLYDWQVNAAHAWERHNGKGIMQVVTGAGKTALAIYLYARLLDRAESLGHEVQLVVVVPRIELARQWAQAIRSMLDLKGLRLGQYHSEHRCIPAHQDILIITQDSARGLLPRMRMDRPVLLVADECHRLGAPAASRILDRDYTWTLGLSATPERGGDLAFEEVLVPRLGPVIWKYGYKEAVRDGIIARFTVLRVKVHFGPDEQIAYDERSDKVTRLLDGLKSQYPQLRRTPPMRFWQVMGDLKRRNPSDQRFDMLTAAASERRAIVHFAREKQAVVKTLATLLPPPRKVLCFHERIEAADVLHGICRAAGRTVTTYHSQIPEPTRSQNLAAFRGGRADWLIACKSLDEGLDIPAVDTVVIVAGTKGPRQLIQRLGRALRRKGPDRAATVFMVEVAGVDDAILEQEGLAELRGAADEVRDIEGGALPAWLDRHGAELVEQQATTPSQRRTPISSQAGRASSNPVRAVINAFRRWTGQPDDESRAAASYSDHHSSQSNRSSWTGTPGTTSYYDKDSSPD